MNAQTKASASFSLRFDMRSPTFGTSASRLYPEAVRMAEYADRHGFHSINLSEHHGSDDGYNPAPVVLASAIAARTEKIRIVFTVMILPLHDPVRVAEDIAVLDNLSGGRVILGVAGGYIEAEFRMFERDITDRPRLVEEGIMVLRRAWTGEAFEFNGRPIRVLPRPIQEHLPILMGGSSPAAARRAGRIADGFLTHLPDLYQVYFDEARRNGRDPVPFTSVPPNFVHVACDPERAWKQIATHALHETNAYGAWLQEAGVTGSYRRLPTLEMLRASGDYMIVTPEECVQLVQRFERLSLHPLMGGMAPELGWESLELFVTKVMPQLRETQIDSIDSSDPC